MIFKWKKISKIFNYLWRNFTKKDDLDLFRKP